MEAEAQARIGFYIAMLGFAFVAALLASIPARIAKRKGYSFWKAFAFGFVAFPFAMVVILLLKTRTPEQIANGNKPRVCPACGRTNSASRLTCKHCRADLVGVPSAQII
jgi:hypothetical protein